MQTIVILLTLTLVAIELARSLPQWLRIRRTGSIDGLSVESIAILTATGIAWIPLASLTHAIPALIATSIWLLLQIAIAWQVLATAPNTRAVFLRYGFSSLAITIAIILVANMLNLLLPALTVLLTIINIAYAAPALFKGLTSKTTNGLSLINLSVNSVEGALYLVAGLGLGGIAPTGTPIIAYIVFGTVALISNLPRLARVLYRRAHKLDKA